MVSLEFGLPVCYASVCMGICCLFGLWLCLICCFVWIVVLSLTARLVLVFVDLVLSFDVVVLGYLVCFYYVSFNDLLLWVWFTDWLACWLVYFIGLVVCWVGGFVLFGFLLGVAFWDFWVWLLSWLCAYWLVFSILAFCLCFDICVYRFGSWFVVLDGFCLLALCLLYVWTAFSVGFYLLGHWFDAFVAFVLIVLLSFDVIVDGLF